MLLNVQRMQNGGLELSEKAGYSAVTPLSMEVTPYSITFYHKVWTQIIFEETNIKRLKTDAVMSSCTANAVKEDITAWNL